MESADIAPLCASLSLIEREGPVRKLDEKLKVEAIQRLHDRRKVLSGAPWTFDNALLVLEKPEGKGMVENLAFSSYEFWVQIYQVPLLCASREIGRSEEQITMIEGIEKPLFGAWMKASGPLRKIYSQKPRGPPSYTEISSVNISRAGISGQATKPNAALIEVTNGLDIKISPPGEESNESIEEKIVAQQESILQLVMSSDPIDLGRPITVESLPLKPNPTCYNKVTSPLRFNNRNNSGKKHWVRKSRAADFRDFRESLGFGRGKRRGDDDLETEEPN
ncbi:hypothetical protein EZV62_015779 [Acer yangbiense]|uniref:Uncharacterized protein n=1 Tax=Acer yangbiense TaxID=1000413 RepID=A0A5C7HLP9_9ROSI|nr:hypothetical protein EZV62_015779 [Acer yangbiense]